jgi:5,10-methylenetetrahydrofolate reductase
MFAKRLFGGGFPVSLEITPPLKPSESVLLRRAQLLGAEAAAINVIQRPERQSSLDASVVLRARGLEPAWHLAVRGRTAAEIGRNLEEAAGAGISVVLVLLGDHAATGAGMTIREAIAMAREALPATLIGATLNQYVADHAASFRNLMPKLAAGASFVQTQPVFELGSFEAAAGRLRREAPDVRILPMVMPLPTAEVAERIAGRLGVAIPREVGSAGDPWAAFEDIVRALLRSGLADGVAVMTFEMDPAVEVGERILSALRGAGVPRPPASSRDVAGEGSDVVARRGPGAL